TVPGTAFEGTERMFGQRLAAAHHVFTSDAHAGPVPLDHVLVQPALDLATLTARGQASRAQRAGPADRPAAGIAARQLAAGLTLLSAHRPQLCLARTTIEVGRGVIAEIGDAKPALPFEPLIAIGRRHIGGDRTVLASLQRLAIIVSSVGDRPERRDAERLLGRLCHRVELAAV